MIAPLMSASTGPNAGQITVSCRGREHRARQRWQVMLVPAGFTNMTLRAASSAFPTRMQVNWCQVGQHLGPPVEPRVDDHDLLVAARGGVAEHHVAEALDGQRHRAGQPGQPVHVVGAELAGRPRRDRDWMIEAMTVPTLAARIAAWAAAGRQIMERTEALFAVAQQAAAVEPLIAGFWQEGREQSRHAQRVFWTRLADDGLLPPGTDLTWLIDTASVIAAAETYLLVTRMLGWDLDTYQDWVAATWTRLLAGPGGQGLHRADQWWTAARRAA